MKARRFENKLSLIGFILLGGVASAYMGIQTIFWPFPLIFVGFTIVIVNIIIQYINFTYSYSTKVMVAKPE